MAQVRLSVGGRYYELVCREGEEAHYRTLAARIDAKTEQVRGAVGSVSEVRQLLLAALLLADDLDTREVGTPAAVDPALLARLTSIAERLETLGLTLENVAPAP